MPALVGGLGAVHAFQPRHGGDGEQARRHDHEARVERAPVGQAEAPYVRRLVVVHRIDAAVELHVTALDHILATMRDVLDSMPDWLAAVVVLSLAASGLCLPDQARRARASTFLPKSRLVALSTTRLTGNRMRSNIFSDVPLGSPEASPMNL